MRPKSLLAVAGAFLFLVGPTFAQADSEFIRGDSNTDALINIADPLYSLNHMFGGGPVICRDAMDANDDGLLDVADPVFMLNYLFGIGAATAPPDPFNWCGPDDTLDGLDCESNQTCDPGGPVQGLTEAELESFNAGRVLMRKEFQPSTGLGPLYNATSCISCHSTPVSGGSSPAYRNFLLQAVGPLGSQGAGPDLPSFVIPAYHLLDGPRPTLVEPTATEPVALAWRNAPPMFGTGLFEFVSNSTIISHGDPEDTITPDGISGRFNTDSLGHIGRFGYKSQANFIEAFIRGAMFNQMGVTTDPVDGSAGVVSLAMAQVSSSLDDPTTDLDGVPDPEMSIEELADLVNFCRFIAPLKPAPFGADETAGESRFMSIGCIKCHVESLDSDFGPLYAYTDLLLHDMGPELADGINMGLPQFSTISPSTSANEFRTQPLWGVSKHAPYLHDGRADTLMDAILAHGGEAEAIRIEFENLSTFDQENIIKFLEAL